VSGLRFNLSINKRALMLFVRQVVRLEDKLTYFGLKYFYPVAVWQALDKKTIAHDIGGG